MKKKNTIYLLPIIIGAFIFIIFSVGLLCNFNKLKIVEKKYYLNNLIKSNIIKDDKKVYLKVKKISSKLAINKKNNKGYYIINDGNYNYIALLSDKKANELLNTDLNNKSIILKGKSKKMSKKLKNIILDKYNYGLDDKEKINIKDFNSYFGDIYLDETK